MSKAKDLYTDNAVQNVISSDTDANEELVQSKNIQRYAFQLTINNPADYGYDHKEIYRRLLENFSTFRYCAMADEIAPSGTPHTHIYICFNSRVRISKVKKHFHEAHIEPAYDTVASNLDYLQKKGKWENTEKAATSVEGSFEEHGNRPTQKGRIPEMEELYQFIRDGYSNAEILALNNDYIMNIDKLDKVRRTLLEDKYKNTRRLDLQVTYITGKTGSGKTRYVLDKHGDSNVYRVSDYIHPFDSYSTHPVLVFEEFRSQIKMSDMLNYCDIYPLALPARYVNKYACYGTVYIISNWKLEEQYKEIQQEHPETWNAFLRRIKNVMIFHDDGTVTTYDTVNAYLNRWDDEKQNDNPFEESEDADHA